VVLQSKEERARCKNMLENTKPARNRAWSEEAEISSSIMLLVVKRKKKPPLSTQPSQ